jgi:hypothetical protein
VIGRVISRPNRPHRLLAYLFGPGRNNEHVSPHLVAAWAGHPAHLEPPGEGTEGRQTYRLAQILEMPAALARGKVPDKLVWHCVVSAADGDPDLGDGAWQVIIAEMMHRAGLSEHGEEDKGVRWVAVHHGGNHVHVVATLARMDGRPVRLHGDWYRVQEAMAWAEREYGLTPVARGGPRGTAERRPTRAEAEKAAREHKKAGRSGRPVPARVQLRRLVEAAAAAARTEDEFFAGLAARGVTARLRYSTTRPGEVTGYAVGLRSDTTGAGGGPVWFSGGKLALDLTLPRLRARWSGGPARPGPVHPDRSARDRSGADRPDRLTGRAMSRQAARPVLAREVLRAARAARTEEQFFAALNRAGLRVQVRPDPDRPGRSTGYSVTLPGLGAGWFAGSGLDPQLGLGQLRARWAAGRTGAAPGPDQFDGASTQQVYAYATAAASRAATDIRAARGRGRADIAWAAADLLMSAAHATGNPELHRAAEGFRRAARAPWGRAPARSPAGAMLRTAAYLLAGCAPVDRRAVVRRALIAALAALARAAAEMRRERMRAEQARRVREEHARRLRDPGHERREQVRSLQAEAARQAARDFAAVVGPTWGADPAAAAAAAASQTAPRSRPARPAPAARRRRTR